MPIPSNLVYHKTSNTRCTSVGNKLVDHSDAVGASPVGVVSTKSSFSTYKLATVDWAITTGRLDENHLSFLGSVRLVFEILR